LTATADALGIYLSDVEAALDTLQQDNFVDLIWRGDHTVWRSDPREISDRLGWLTVTDLIRDQVPALQSFAAEVRDAGFRHVLLLGMGGSSLGPGVLRQTFGSAPGYPELIVLDTTVPAWIRATTDAIDPAYTLFLVSSKSGGTIETMSGYSYFRSLVEKAVGSKSAGQSFVAITDRDTPLDSIAQEKEFRRIFLNPTDIGGRYSILSYFGLIPAALIGLDLAKLLDRADSMRNRCALCVPTHSNPGARLGAALASLALKGRDKLTLVTSPSISAFGLWAEQLIAESTGKEDKGIVPVAGETLARPDSYGDDRLFVHLRLDGDDNATADDALERIETSGQPVLRLELRDRYDLGAELFRWQLATAVARAILDIQPFDQPDVQLSKDVTAAVLSEHRASGLLPPSEAPGSLPGLLSLARPGDYLAIMAYIQPTPENDRALTLLRNQVVGRYRIATTLGYGPASSIPPASCTRAGRTPACFSRSPLCTKRTVKYPARPTHSAPWLMHRPSATSVYCSNWAVASPEYSLVQTTHQTCTPWPQEPPERTTIMQSSLEVTTWN